jgi:hypothetical protein
MGFEPRLVMSNVRLMVKIRHFGEAAMPKESAAHASTLCVIPGHWLYNCREKHKKNLSQGIRKVPAGLLYAQ